MSSYLEVINYMSKYTRHYSEFINTWNKKIHFIKQSCNFFDEGDEDQAENISTHLRVLFHDTKRSHSVYKSLNNSLYFLSNAKYSPTNLISTWNLLSVELNSQGIFYKSNLSHKIDKPLITFDNWWNEIVFDDKNDKLSRRDVVLIVANTDGGAHLDPNVDENDFRLNIENSLGIQDQNGASPQGNPLYQAVRTIAEEFLYSVRINSIGNYTENVISEKRIWCYTDKYRRYLISEKAFDNNKGYVVNTCRHVKKENLYYRQSLERNSGFYLLR